MINLCFKMLNEKAILPQKAHETDAGWDLYATEDALIYPHCQTKVDTGIAVQASFVDKKDAEKWLIFLQIEGTSGNAVKLGLFPIAGIIDQNYTGEIGVVLCNHTNEPVQIKAGKKIAQLIPKCIPKVSNVEILKPEEDFEQTDRGSAGFGSTGIAH